MKIRWRAVAMATALSAAALTAQAMGVLQLRPLHACDTPALLQTPRAYPLIVEIWSLDCSYCRESIVRIAQWRRTAKKNMGVVMASMDGPDQTGMLNRALAPLARDGKIGVVCMPQYASAGDMSERLRAALDPDWQDEMPRTITLRPDGKRHASSRLLTPQVLETVLRDQSEDDADPPRC